MERQRVGILVFDDVEVLDFCGPFEVLLRHPAGREPAARGPVAVRGRAGGGAGRPRHGGRRSQGRRPTHALARLPAPRRPASCPGGWGTRREIGNPALLAWIAARGRGGGDADVGVHGRDAARPRRPARRPARDDALAIARLDAGVVPQGHGRARRCTSSRTATCSRRRASPPASTWRCGSSRATTARRSRARRRARWSIRIPTTCDGGV